jgi:hypothetical protein
MSFAIRGGRACFCVVALILFLAPPGSAQAAVTPRAWIDPAGAISVTIPEFSILDTGCADGNGCVWTQIDFEGSKLVFDVSDAGSTINLGSYDRSAKNRFNARYMAFYRGGGGFLSCINPGSNDRNLNLDTDLLVIGGSGSHC